MTSFTTATRSSLPLAMTTDLPKEASSAVKVKLETSSAPLLEATSASPTAWSTTRPAMLPFWTSRARAGYFSSSNSSLSGRADWISWDWMVPF